MLNLFKKIIIQFIPKWRFMNTYSQSGEDVIMYYFFFSRGITKPSYLDIGANEPIYGSNTFLFYKRGSTGVLVEADPDLIPQLKKKRPDDITINAGVSFDNEKNATFFIFKEKAHNTLSKQEAEIRKQTPGQILMKEVSIPLININEIFINYFNGKTPDILSIDVEGIDFEILKSMNWNLYRPTLICVETITFSMNNTEEKITEIVDFMNSVDYTIYADSHINTIFVNSKFNK